MWKSEKRRLKEYKRNENILGNDDYKASLRWERLVEKVKEMVVYSSVKKAVIKKERFLQNT